MANIQYTPLSIMDDAVDDVKHHIEEQIPLNIESEREEMCIELRVKEDLNALTPDQIQEFANAQIIHPRCCDDCHCFLRFWCNFVYFIIGLLSFILVLLPLMLYFAVWSCIREVLCCKICVKTAIYGSRRYEPSTPTSRCCTSYTRYYFVEWNLKLLSSPLNTRGCCWNLQSCFVSIYNHIEYIIENASAGPQYYVNDLANEFGDYFPLLNGIACVNSDDIKHYFMYETVSDIRSHNVFSSPINDTARINGKWIALFTSRTDTNHSKSRRLFSAFFTLYNDRYCSNQSVLKDNLRRLINKNSSVSQAVFGKNVARIMFYTLFNEDLTDEEASAIAYYSLLGALWCITPSWIHLFLCGYRFERKYESIVSIIKNYFIRIINKNPSHPVFTQMYKIMNEENIPISEGFISNIIALLISFGGLSLFSYSAIRYLRNDPYKNLILWEEDPVAFLKETQRLNTSPSRVTVHLKEDTKLNVSGKQYMFPKGTHIQYMTMIRNCDPQIFGADAIEFNPKRKGLDEMISWNQLESVYKHGVMYKKKPRHCMGHDFSLFVVEFALNQHKPLLNIDKMHMDEFDITHLFSERYQKALDEYTHTLDQYTNTLMKLTFVATAKHNKNPPDCTDIGAPIIKPTEVKNVFVPSVGLWVPETDEEYPEGYGVLKVFLRSLISNQTLMPFEDLFDEWASIDVAVAFREKHFTDIPPPNIEFDKSGLIDDDIMSQLAFGSFCCHCTRRLNENDRTKLKIYDSNIIAEYISDFSVLSMFEVRTPYERYGAIAYFDEIHAIIAIYWCHKNKLCKPTDDEWEHCKYVWKSSAFAFVTVADHLFITHMFESNTLALYNMKSFPINHPFRVFIKPFTFRSTYINYASYKLLISDHGLIHRLWAFEYEELLNLFHFVKVHYKFTLLPDKIDASMKSNIDDSIFAWNKDSNEFWEIMKKYVTNYVNIYYNANDPHVIDFQNNLSKTFGIGVIDSKAMFIDVLTQLFCSVTAEHEQFGQVSDYTLFPHWIGTRLQKNRECCNVQEYIQLCCLVTGTGLRNPALAANDKNDHWEHLFLKDDHHKEVIDIYQQFRNDLSQLQKNIDKRNETRKYPLNSFNPRYLRCSVSV